MASVNVAMVGFTPRQDHFQDDINLGEGFEEGSPDNHDPLIIARHMASKGVTLVSLQLSLKRPSADRCVTVLCGLRASIERVLCE